MRRCVTLCESGCSILTAESMRDLHQGALLGQSLEINLKGSVNRLPHFAS